MTPEKQLPGGGVGLSEGRIGRFDRLVIYPVNTGLGYGQFQVFLGGANPFVTKWALRIGNQ